MKKILSICLVSLCLLTLSVRPSFAAGNIFQQISQTISNGLTRVYLLLPGDKPGDVVMSQTASSLQNLKSAQVNAVFSATLFNDDTEAANLKLTESGPVKVQNIYNTSSIKQSMNLAVQATMQGVSLQGNVDVKTNGQTIYLKINEVPPLPFDLSNLKGKWLKAVAPTMSADKVLTYLNQT